MGDDPATGRARPHVDARSWADAVERAAAVVVAGYRGDAERARASRGDPEPPVRAAALGALARCGALGPTDLLQALGDPAPGVRCRALELVSRRWLPAAGAAGGRPPSTVTKAVRETLGDPDALVAEAACWAVAELADRRALPVLCALVRDHPEPLVREGAVSALGAIAAKGRQQSEPALRAVLHSTGDRPAVRRRAAVALSAFTGDEVDSALERLAQDRDWQVRQVAEEILRA